MGLGQAGRILKGRNSLLPLSCLFHSSWSPSIPPHAPLRRFSPCDAFLMRNHHSLHHHRPTAMIPLCSFCCCISSRAVACSSPTPPRFPFFAWLVS
ncbi:hypothetical protein VTJ04DRAFT_1835 [Mycothermus thermophilus]|uniref:uncharacterized protein n=1 Tax=Humicola insolens TaxID=85995 RepID=UPI00374494F6